MGGETLPTVSADLHAVTVHFFSRENNTELFKKSNTVFSEQEKR